MADFLMPSLGADMEDAIVVEWMVEPGSMVKRGDIVAVVETDKGAIDIEIFEDGIIDQILAGIGESVPVDTVLATLHQEGEAPTVPTEADVPPMPIRQPGESAGSFERTPTPVRAAERMSTSITPAGDSSGRLRISPLARRRAAEQDVDVSQLRGSGADGAITAVDVERATATVARAQVATGPLVRSSIGNAMARSKREIPHYYLSTSIDMSTALVWMEARNEELPVADRMLYSVLLLKAVALALEQIPELNGRFEDGEFVPSAAINLGMAIALRKGGLVAPALMETNKHDLSTLMQAFRDLVNRARRQKLRASELSSPTMTITNLGEQGVETVLPVIYPPQVAIVGFGSIVQRPWVVGGEISVRRIVVASLAADHRVSDGRRGGLFLGTINELLQRPEAL